MAGEITVTFAGNLTADPELRYAPSGAPVANFTVAVTPRMYDRELGEWRDGDTTYVRCAAWRTMAENVADSLDQGDRVVVSGRFRQRNWETSEGEKRTSYELDVDEIGVSLRFAAAKAVKASRRRAAAPASVSTSSGDDEPPF